MRPPTARHSYSAPAELPSDRSLAAIVRDTSSKPGGLFLGFAGVADEKVFAQEIGLASRVLGERYDIDGRSLSLLNDARTPSARRSPRYQGLSTLYAASRPA